MTQPLTSELVERLLNCTLPLNPIDRHQIAAELTRLREEVERKNEVLRKIAERSEKLRRGTDDWFELTEFEMAARAALGDDV